MLRVAMCVADGRSRYELTSFSYLTWRLTSTALAKCDGQKPACQRCERAALICTGYERSLDFAFFDGQSVLRVKTSMRNKPTTPPTYLSQTSPEIEDVPVSNPLRRNGISATGPNNLITVHTSIDQALTISQYKVAFNSVLQDRYVPDLPKPPNQTEGVCSAWIATACDLSSRKGSGMLRDSLLAMSLALVGGERHDPDIRTAGLRYYSRALAKLRVELQRGALALGELQMDVVLVTCLAFITYEVRVIGGVAGANGDAD